MARRTFSREFKIEAVKLVTEQGMSRRRVGDDLGVDRSTIGEWVAQFGQSSEGAFPGKGHPRDEDMRRLERELAEVKMERDILKKAVGIFSQMPRR